MECQSKKWYIDTMPEEYVKFSKWILQDTDDAVIATEYISVIEGKQKCWKCRSFYYQVWIIALR